MDAGYFQRYTFQLSSIVKYTIINSQTLEDFNLCYHIKSLQNMPERLGFPVEIQSNLAFQPQTQ